MFSRAALLQRALYRSSFRPSSIFPSPSPSLRRISTSVRIHQEDEVGGRPKASHPTKHAPRPVSSGKPVAELTEEDERERSGVKGKPDAGVDHPGLAHAKATDLFSLRDRTIIVTGGGRGLGLTVAQALLESGAHVVCLDLLPEPSQPLWDEAVQYAEENGLGLKYYDVDVTKPDAVQSVFKRLFDDAPEHAPVRGLFTAAGIQIMMPAIDYTHAKFQKVNDVNLTGTFLCCQAFAREYFARNPEMNGQAGRGGASVVMTASMSGHVANLGMECVAYNASKAGVVQMAKNLAQEWSRRGVRVNTLSPGYIRTALTAAQLDAKPELKEIWLEGSLLGRLSTPDEFRGPVIYLLSDASSFMTGADLLVDGGHCAT